MKRNSFVSRFINPILCWSHSGYALEDLGKIEGISITYRISNNLYGEIGVIKQITSLLDSVSSKVLMHGLVSSLFE